MHRTPPRKHPRIAAIDRSGRLYIVVVVDPWDVRTVATLRSRAAVRRALLRERPDAVVSARALPWLSSVRVVDFTPTELRFAEAMPELRRFVGTRHGAAICRTARLALNALEHQTV